MRVDAKIMMIAPYIELAEEAIRLNLELNLRVIVKHALLSESANLLDEAKRESVDAIVSRGGVAIRFSEQQDEIPVVEIPITGFDILEAVSQGAKIGEEMAIVGFSNIVQGANRVAKILSLPNLRVIYRENGKECLEIISILKNQGVKVIIGDTLPVKIAEDFGLTGILIKSSREGIITAYQEATRLAKIRRQDRLQREQLQTILNYTYNGIVTVDKHGLVTSANQEAERLLGKRREEMLQRPSQIVIPILNMNDALDESRKEIGIVVNYGKNRIVINRIPIILDGEVCGAVATLQEVDHIQEVNRKIRDEVLKKGHVAENFFENIIGKSKSIIETIDTAKAYSYVDSTMVIEGETGVGKELFAQAIHNHSDRRKGPFVAVNCAAIPATLLESELFGYVRGAFTDARREGKMGLFEMASGGTLFMDEISEISIDLQAKLLRVLQEREIMRIGDDRRIKIDARIITASNQPLIQLVVDKCFRADLYYRINILPLTIPPLRERSEDISLLSMHFLREYSRKQKKSVSRISDNALAILEAYSWPGNIRELSAVIERSVVMANDEIIEAHQLNYLEKTKHMLQTKLLDDEKILRAMLIAGGNKNQAAELLGVDRSTLWRYLKKIRTTAPLVSE